VLLSVDGAGLMTGVLAKLNVKLSLCIVKHNDMKMYGGAEQQLHGFNFGVELCGKLKALVDFAPAQRARSIHWTKLLDGPLRLSELCCERNNFCPCQVSNTGHPLTVVTELRRLYTLERHMGIWGRH
jgi:hypothetical protein